MTDTGAGEASGSDERERDDDRAHLADVPDGCGCAEVWERLSDRRDEG
jgi:hypothetical protein